MDIYWEHLGGHGLPIIVLHGWGQSSDATRPLGHLLTACGDVHVVDLPGFGRSPRPASDWNTFEYADCIVDQMNQRGIDAALIVGHSFGGKVALCMAMSYPDRVAGLALVAASGLRYAQPAKQRLRARALGVLARATKAYDRMTGSRVFEKEFAPRFGSADYRAAGEMRGILVKTVNDDLSNELHRVHCPTLLLWGDADADTPIAIGQQLEQRIPQARLVTLPGKGHQLLHDVGSHLVASYVIPFCRQATHELCAEV